MITLTSLLRVASLLILIPMFFIGFLFSTIKAGFVAGVEYQEEL